MAWQSGRLHDHLNTSQSQKSEVIALVAPMEAMTIYNTVLRETNSVIRGIKKYTRNKPCPPFTNTTYETD